MTVFMIDAAMDAELDYLRNNITERYVCTGNPTTRAAAISAALATQTGLSSANFSAPLDGDSSGRKVTKNAETGDGIDATGQADTICYCDGTTLLWRVDITGTPTLNSGGTLDTNAHDHEIADAA